MPDNVRFLRHINHCYDWWGPGKLLETCAAISYMLPNSHCCLKLRPVPHCAQGPCTASRRGTFGERSHLLHCSSLTILYASAGCVGISPIDTPRSGAGWVVRLKVITAGYKYFIMLNSSVRGPFLPPYLARVPAAAARDMPASENGRILTGCGVCAVQGSVAWHRLFTQRLSSDVLLVGPTISCEGTPNRLNMSELRQNPHVQSFVLATNRVQATLIS